MGILLADGFDFYNSATDFVYVGSPWVSAGGGVSATTPYGVGQSATVNTAIASAQFSTNETTIYFAFTCYTPNTFTGTNVQGLFLTLMDVANNQITLQWGQDGNFYLRAGGTGGSIIAGSTWAHGMAPSSWCHWQGKVVIDSSAGSVELRKNNNPVDDFSLSSINTRNGSTNSYANKISITNATSTWQIDDCFVNSATGAAPTSWPGQLRATQLMPNGDISDQLTPSAGATAVIGTNSTVLTAAGGTNTIYYISNVASAGDIFTGGAVSKLTAKLSAGFTGKMQAALYTDAAGVPGTLVAQTVEITNPVLGDNDLTFSSPPTVTDNTPYWMAVWANAAFTFNSSSNTGAQKRTQALTYATGGFPATAASASNTSENVSVRATITVSNYGMVNENTMNSDTDYVYGSTAGLTDIYSLTDLVTVPASIAAVVTRQSFKKSDTGGRTATTRLVSGGNNYDQTVINLATTYSWQNVYFSVDPNTGAAWTFAGVNALQIGPRIVA